MLITVDAGNTNITLGVFKEKKVYATFRMTTQMARTSDEYGVLIAEMLGRKGISPKDIEAVIIFIGCTQDYVLINKWNLQIYWITSYCY